MTEEESLDRRCPDCKMPPGYPCRFPDGFLSWLRDTGDFGPNVHPARLREDA